MGAGSTVFVRNVLGDCLCSEVLRDAEFALYDIDAKRLSESAEIIGAMNETMGGHAKVTAHLGVENRKEALRGADFVVNAIQVGLYDPCTIIDFEVPKKYGLRQTIGDTLGIGGIMRALRTIPVLADFARDMEEVCPDALFLNYTNPMAMLTGYMQRYTGVKTVGLCHSVQTCSETLLKELDMEDKLQDRKELIAGINHMVWTTSKNSAITAPSPASTILNTTCSTSNPNTRSSLSGSTSPWTNTPAAASTRSRAGPRNATNCARTAGWSTSVPRNTLPTSWNPL